MLHQYNTGLSFSHMYVCNTIGHRLKTLSLFQGSVAERVGSDGPGIQTVVCPETQVSVWQSRILECGHCRLLSDTSCCDVWCSVWHSAAGCRTTVP